jgi:hypothetical protein
LARTPLKPKEGLNVPPKALVLLPGSLLEMKILFEHRIARFHERSANRRSLGFARDDKKERAAVRKERLLNRGIFQNKFGQLSSSAVSVR